MNIDTSEVDELIDGLCIDFEIDKKEMEAVFQDKLFNVAKSMNADPESCEYSAANLSWVCFRLGYITGIIRERTGTLP